MDTKKLTKIAGWAIIVFALVVLGVPLVLHVLHLGLVIIKLVVEAAVVVALVGIGFWLVRR